MYTCIDTKVKTGSAYIAYSTYIANVYTLGKVPMAKVKTIFMYNHILVILYTIASYNYGYQIQMSNTEV